jgi:putative thioredoxin
MTQATTLIATAENFVSDVIEASSRLPVLVDFWAPWCGPCKQLMPILERLATEYSGRFTLAKVNTDEEQELAAQIGIRSLPTVVLFKNGKGVDHFMGVVPEARIKQMLDKHLPAAPAAPATPLEQARSLKGKGDFDGARQLLTDALTREPEDIPLRAELAEIHVMEGEFERARTLLSTLQAREPNHAAVKRLLALLTFSDVIAAHPDEDVLREHISRQPNDLDARHALAVHQLLAGEHADALTLWLSMMREDRSFKEDLARKSLVMSFELIGNTDPAVQQARREMARLLF